MRRILLIVLAVGCVGCSSTEKVERLIDLLAEHRESSKEWNLAVDQLALMRDFASRRLVKVLSADFYKGREFREFRNEIARIRVGACRALGRIGYRPAAATVVGYVKESFLKNERLAAIWATGILGKQEAEASKLHPLLEEEDREIRLEAALALFRMGDENGIAHMVEIFKHDDDEAVARAMDVLLEIPYYAVDPLLTVAKVGRPERREQAGALLERLYNIFITQLEDNESRIRIEAAEALGKLEDQRAVEKLAYLLEKDGSSGVQFNTAVALAQLGDRRGSDYLLNALGKENNIGHRIDARKRLTKILDTVKPEVIRILSEGNVLARAGAARILGDGADRDALPALYQAAGDTSSSVRLNVALALGKIEDPSSESVLLALSKDKDHAVASYAHWALKKIHE